MSIKKVREEIVKSVEEVLKDNLDTEGTPAVGVCFTIPPDNNEVHFITNVSREDGIKIFRTTADKMQAQIN